MKDGTYWSVLLGLLLGGLLLALTRSWWMLPAAAVLAAAPPVLAGWMGARQRVRSYLSETPRLDWTPDPPRELQERIAEQHAELERLGYAPLGWLGREPAQPRIAVFAHCELPIYALLYLDVPTSGTVTVHLDTFFPEGRLATTGSLEFARATAHAETGGPRLVQLRPGGTPTALDGQHVGTLKPWLGAKRQPLPVTREALPVYLVDDYRRLRHALEARGWLSFSEYLGHLRGKPKGILTF